MTQTDAQAALAAAALIVANSGYAPSPLSAERITLSIADGFLSWLQQRRPMPDERLIPNEDFRAPSQDATTVIDQIPRSPGATYAGVHMLAPEHCTTPSGNRACLCGRAWPCSLAFRPIRRGEVGQ